MLQKWFFGLTLLNVFLLYPLASDAHPVADKDLAITVIDELVQSLKDHPNQFNLQVTTVGYQSVAGPGGVGTHIVAQGGGPGSHTTGLSVSASTGNIQIVQAAANQEMIKRSEEAIKILKEMKAGLQQQKVDKPSLLSSLKNLGKTYLPDAVKVIFEILIKKSLGL